MLVEDFATVKVPKLPGAVLTSKAFDETSPARMRRDEYRAIIHRIIYDKPY